ncbi:MAG: isoleucyl-tRNA synthase [Bacteroides sp. SM23_62_1]|nr:MAG: isoleucyl-tRNA synthase [Bacteroides sp. SM23_62_1]
MSTRFTEYKSLDLPKINKEVLSYWKKNKTFEKGLEIRKTSPAFIFYEGPPSANGIPGIHHVISRTIKDIFCRYKSQKGYRVDRKAGWDTHGLPVELAVETSLGITKEDIGKKISVSEYNNTCKQEVMRYTREWEDFTDKMGYWINMDEPYITYDNRYIETLWYLLMELYKKEFLYKGYTIQPYSPAAGTGLSSHELNQPGCYRDIKDTSVVALFKLIRDKKSDFLYKNIDCDVFILAWTTTPWTLPSNTALAMGPDIDYIRIKTFHPYSGKPIVVILAGILSEIYFPPENRNLDPDHYQPGDKEIPFKVLSRHKGREFEGIKYEQLITWVKPHKEAFRILLGDFVSTEEGTGVVHIAPTFGADDYKIAREYDIPPLIIIDREGTTQPLVDKKGRFYLIEDMNPDFVKEYVNTKVYGEFAGKFVKNEYDETSEKDDETTDISIAVDLKRQNKVFQISKYIHSYPHCWRTDKPVLYYPLESWFIRTTALKDRLIELNNTINWKPKSTGVGRFGQWLENLVDWNLSRSRFWGTPLPIWMTEDKTEEKCIGSLKELKDEIVKSVEAGFMKDNPLADFIPGDNSSKNYNRFDLHRPFVDNIILVASSGKKMYREPDLIDGWFDSGAMPYAQWHYPFENKDEFNHLFPADFISEGVEQTRGWFFTLHAIATMISDSVSSKTIVSHGLVLDKNGNKMSKRLGNSVDPFHTIETYGADPLRWYMITNSQPWDNLKFDIAGVDEVRRKFFGTLFNTYSFFALYANIDRFRFNEEDIPVAERPEIDRWIISLLNTLTKEVQEYYDDYEPTWAGRAIQEFVIENLSNWYVRLNRKRFWGGDFSKDKLSAYQTLFTCLVTVARLMAPLAPFFAERLYNDLNQVTKKFSYDSVHHTDFPEYDESLIDKELEERMDIAQKISSLILGLRRKVNIKVRQPLNKVLIPLLNKKYKTKIEAVKNLILSEINVKELEYLSDSSEILIKKIKPDFKALGPMYGKLMKDIVTVINQMSHDDILNFEKEGSFTFRIGEQKITLTLDDVEILSEDIPGWLVASEGDLTVALDISVTEELRFEGIAREFINRIQNYRKESGFDVTDKILVSIQKHDAINKAIEKNKEYIGSQTLAKEIRLTDKLEKTNSRKVEIDDDITTLLKIEKVI